jgi:hypothetical protein
MSHSKTLRISTKKLEILNEFAKKHGLLQRFVVDCLIDGIEKNEVLMRYVGRPINPEPPAVDPNWCPPPIGRP